MHGPTSFNPKTIKSNWIYFICFFSLVDDNVSCKCRWGWTDLKLQQKLKSCLPISIFNEEQSIYAPMDTWTLLGIFFLFFKMRKHSDFNLRFSFYKLRVFFQFSQNHFQTVIVNFSQISFSNHHFYFLAGNFLTNQFQTVVFHFLAGNFFEQLFLVFLTKNRFKPQSFFWRAIFK